MSTVDYSAWVSTPPLFTDLEDNLGVYVNKPGNGFFIILHQKFEGQPDFTAMSIYKSLLDFHNSLPLAYRLFPMFRFFEDLHKDLEPALELVDKYKPVRKFTYTFMPDTYRLVGT